SAQPLLGRLIRGPALEIFTRGGLAVRVGLVGLRIVGLRIRVGLAVVRCLARLVARELRLRAFTLLAAVAGLAGRRLRFESFARLLRLVAAGVAAVGLLRRVAGLALILPALLLLAGRRLLLRRRILREVLFQKV